MISQSALLMGHYNAIGLLKVILTKISKKYPDHEFFEVPGSEFQQAAMNSTFYGWNGTLVQIDDEADQILPFIMLSASTEFNETMYMQTFRFNDVNENGTFPLTIINQTTDTLFKMFKQTEPDCGYNGENTHCKPCGGNCVLIWVPVIIFISCCGIGTVVVLWWKSSTQETWEIPYSHVVFNPLKYAKPKMEIAFNNNFDDDEDVKEYASRKSRQSGINITESILKVG